MGNLCGPPSAAEHLQVAVLGLDGAGKTSLLQHLLQQGSWALPGFGSAQPPPPPTGIQPPAGGVAARGCGGSESVGVATLNYRGKQFVFVDLGGRPEHRRRWQEYIGPRTFAVIYVVDASAAERLPEAREVLHNVVIPLLPLPVTPVSVFNHKADRIGALSSARTAAALGLDALGRRRWRIMDSSVRRPSGIPVDALAFLAEAHQQQQEALMRHLSELRAAVHPAAASTAPSSVPSCGDLPGDGRPRRRRQGLRRWLAPAPQPASTPGRGAAQGEADSSAPPRPERAAAPGAGERDPAAAPLPPAAPPADPPAPSPGAAAGPTACSSGSASASAAVSASACTDSQRGVGSLEGESDSGASGAQQGRRRRPRRRGRGHGRRKPQKAEEDAADAAPRGADAG